MALDTRTHKKHERGMFALLRFIFLVLFIAACALWVTSQCGCASVPRPNLTEAERKTRIVNERVMGGVFLGSFLLHLALDAPDE